MKKIIFVCTGNTCRSPMAEAIAKNIFKNKDIKADVISRGLSVFSKAPMSSNSVKALENNNIAFSEHFSAPLTEHDISSADLILTMTKAHKDMLIAYDASISSKTYTLYGYITGEDCDIQDPYGGDYSEYENCFNELYNLIDKFTFKEMT